MKKTLGQIAHDAGESAGGWARSWNDMADGQREVWEKIAAAVVAGAIDATIADVERLRAAITQTLNKNGHLADGDNCTLIALKRAMPDWELPE